MDVALLAEARQHRLLHIFSTDELLLELHLRDLDAYQVVQVRAEMVDWWSESIPAAQMEALQKEWLERARRDMRLTIQTLPDAELLAWVEARRYLGSSFGADALERKLLEFEVRMLNEELQRRDELRSVDPTNPLLPPGPRRDPQLWQRIERAHQRFPIEVFCEQLLMVDLNRRGAYSKGLCPFPDHPDKTPSFIVYQESGRARCYGCQRGGDIFDLTALYFGTTSFYESLLRIEAAY